MNKEASGKDNSGGASNADEDKLYEDRGAKKTIVRLMTVGAYMFSVSSVALALSGYYIFLWHPPNSRLIHAHAAHLRADSEMDFMVADSLTVIQVDKSNESRNLFNDVETNNRYKYNSNSIQDAAEDHRFIQEDKELTRDDATYENIQQFQRNNSVNKPIVNLNNSNEKTNHKQTDNASVPKNEKNAIEMTNFSANNTKINEIEVKPDDSVSEQRLSKDGSKSNKKVNYLSSEDVKIFKKFFKIL